MLPETHVDSEASLGASEEGQRPNAVGGPDSEDSFTSRYESESEEEGEDMSAAALHAEVSPVHFL